MKSQLTNRKNSVADLSLESAAGAFSFGRRRGSIILVLFHTETCAACSVYLDKLSQENPELAEWDAEIAVVAPVAKGDAAVEHATVRVLYDPEQSVAKAAGIDTPGVVIVDQWSDITDIHAAGKDHEFPAVADVIASVRYLATQCPECEGETL